MSDAPSLVANRYRLLQPCGVGGMGRVWRARDEALHRDVAVKQIILQPELLDSPRDVAMERTLREARAAARLSHPNVVRVYDVFAAEGHPWLVMEYVPSRSLDQVIRADGPLGPTRVAEIGLAVLDALEAAHRAGVEHRDIKPANVLLAESGRIVLTDFGIARVEGEGHLTRTGLVLGSPEFIAPERARGVVAGPASDLWSLGATLYAAVEGRSPFGRGSAMETLSALASEEAEPPQRAGAMAPVLRALLCKDLRMRAGFVETAELLRAAAATEPEVAEPQAAMQTEHTLEPEHTIEPQATSESGGADTFEPAMGTDAEPGEGVEQQSPGDVASTGIERSESGGVAQEAPGRTRGKAITLVGATVLVVVALVGWLTVGSNRHGPGGGTAAPGGTTGSAAVGLMAPTVGASPSFSPTVGPSLMSSKASAKPTLSATSSPSPSGPTRYKFVHVRTGKVMTVPSRSRAANDILVQQADSGGVDQRWLLVRDADGMVRIRSVFNGLVVSPLGGSVDPYALVAQVPDVSAAATRWRLKDVGGGKYQVQNSNSGLLLALQYMVDTDGTRLFQHPDTGNDDPLWRLIPAR
ncbi:serine/threonine protein kinase [Dactylosporangium sp. CA-233914]|uniref:serine/threonine protein kinase n=1 Tax=Dactylosporangium sp. CA-233914 TaxID=3239934 RepID=UPI003D90F1E1